MQNIMKYKQEEYHTLAEYYLDMACKNLPVVNQAISKYGDVSLSDYLQNFIHKAKPSYQQQDDFLEAVHRYAAPLLGESVAQQTVRDLAANPVVLTSNHLGVEYFAQSLQSSLLFSLNRMIGNSSGTTVPVFSCGNVPLDNLTYPQGLLLYNINHTGLEVMPRKLPVFPNRLRRWLVSVAQAFDQDMIIRVQARLGKMVCDKQISHTLADPIHQIFQEDYCSDSVMALRSYSQQSAVLNGRIWKRLFPEVSTVPDMVCLELEKITAMLLEYDLSNPKSLAWCAMFDPVLRGHILEGLEGVRGCWNLKKLALSTDPMDKEQRKSHKNCGTVFFWGIDDSGRRIPFYLETDDLNNEVLRGVDARGKTWKLPYTPQTIIHGLNDKRLVPSLFTCFLTLSFARGIVCVGGYFQGVYLPMMQEVVVTALQKTNYHDDIADFVTQVPTDCYLSGMLAVMAETDDGCLIPAGPAEIIAGGGITRDDIEKMLSLTVREAHIAGLFETVSDIVPKELRVPGRKKELASDCQQLLEGKMVLK